MRSNNAPVPYFKFRNAAASVGEIFLYGPIGQDFFGDGISAKTFTAEMKKLGQMKTLNVHIDSPGGSVTDARAIYTQLVENKAKVNVYIDAVAASAASFIAMAGDTIAISEGGFFMIHEARIPYVQGGTASQIRANAEKTAFLAETLTRTIADTYAARIGKPVARILDWMQAETWFTGADAIKNGFADSLLENKRIAACAYPDVYNNLPAVLMPRRAKAQHIVRKWSRHASIS